MQVEGGACPVIEERAQSLRFRSIRESRARSPSRPRRCAPRGGRAPPPPPPPPAAAGRPPHPPAGPARPPPAPPRPRPVARRSRGGAQTEPAAVLALGSPQQANPIGRAHV